MHAASTKKFVEFIRTLDSQEVRQVLISDIENLTQSKCFYNLQTAISFLAFSTLPNEKIELVSLARRKKRLEAFIGYPLELFNCFIVLIQACLRSNSANQLKQNLFISLFCNLKINYQIPELELRKDYAQAFCQSLLGILDELWKENELNNVILIAPLFAQFFIDFDFESYLTLIDLMLDKLTSQADVPHDQWMPLCECLTSICLAKKLAADQEKSSLGKICFIGKITRKSMSIKKNHF